MEYREPSLHLLPIPVCGARAAFSSSLSQPSCSPGHLLASVGPPAEQETDPRVHQSRENLLCPGDLFCVGSSAAGLSHMSCSAHLA